MLRQVTKFWMLVNFTRAFGWHDVLVFEGYVDGGHFHQITQNSLETIACRLFQLLNLPKVLVSKLNKDKIYGYMIP